MLINDYAVPADRIVVIDAGTTEFSWRNANEFSSGSLTQDPAEAQKNRVVAIISDNSPLVEELKATGYL